MITKKIKLPKDYKKYFKTEDSITELIEDYIEKKQDMQLKKELSEDENFLIMNKLMEKELWKIL